MRGVRVSLALLSAALPLLVRGALSIVSPSDGVEIPTLGDGLSAYLGMTRIARASALSDAGVRAAFVDLGAMQRPVELRWSGSTADVWQVSICADNGEEQLFAVTNATSARFVNLETGRRYRWMVEGGGETVSSSFRTAQAGPRLLTARGLPNFRDCGGWAGLNGRRVRQGMILRSAALQDNARRLSGSHFNAKFAPAKMRITAEGLSTLANEFGVRTELDLRAPSETGGIAGSPIAGAKRVSVPFVAYGEIEDLLKGREAFARIFHLFTEQTNYPILIESSCGCDRAGTVALLLNALLGVDEDDLVKDWAVSAFSTADPKFQESRLSRLLDYLSTFSGKTLAERAAQYARACGITADKVAAFREIMLEI